MLVDCMTVEEQIQALRDGYKIASYVEGEVYFHKTIKTTETQNQFEVRINSDRVFHKQLIDTADAHNLNAALARAEFKQINERLEQYVQLQRQYYKTTFGVK
jgi:TPP-dependent indolepyruvate ferredoxin oxidoreductase alpha subunit